jgi:DtxR family Mn-dependent transcriptional regulator
MVAHDLVTDATSLAPALLECLDAIHRLGEEHAGPTLGQVARRLRLGRETAAERVRDLERLRLVAPGEHGRLALTADGARLSLALLRKHRLVERLLIDRLDLPWDRVHEEASRLTPMISDEVADRLAIFLGRPATCPHGNPIPSPDGAMAAEEATPLHRLSPGRAGIIVRIDREEPELLKQLATLGLLPDMRVEVEEIAPLGGPVLVTVGSSRYALGRRVASRILVRPA